MNWKQIKVDINNISYQQIIDFLNYAQENESYRNRRLARILRDARLSDGSSAIEAVDTQYWNNRFHRLANAIGYDMGVMDIYRIVDPVLYDINSTRNWITNFKILAESDYGISPKGQLVALGQAILGRATELCPIETGRLRASGEMLVYEDYIIIYFDCPYATYVHEDLNKHHIIGQAKFLEQAMQEMLPKNKVWVEHHGESIVWCAISINYDVEYRHYN